MFNNPYARYLSDGENPLEVMAATPVFLREALSRIPVERRQQPWAEGKWSIREMMAHLADCELAFGFRIRQALAEPGIAVQAFDQTLYARHYAAYEEELARQTFLTCREWNLRLLTTVSEKEWSNTMTHPERGTMTLWQFLEVVAGHDRNHLQQIQTVAGES